MNNDSNVRNFISKKKHKKQTENKTKNKNKNVSNNDSNNNDFQGKKNKKKVGIYHKKKVKTTDSRHHFLARLNN